MARFEMDWNYLRRYTAVPGLTLIAAILLLASALWINAKQDERYRILNADWLAMHEDYDRLVEQRRLVTAYHRRYQQFSSLGFIGRERRLDWLETFREASTSLALPRVSYSIQPQRAVVPPVETPIAGGEVHIRVSELQLDLGLVHELDLLRFFDELQGLAPGLVKVDRCALELADDERNSSRAITHIYASCSAQIYSVITSDVSPETS